MGEINRYTATCDIRGMERNDVGAWVKHSDYKQMHARAEKAEAKIERLKEALEFMVTHVKYCESALLVEEVARWKIVELIK